MKTEDRPGEALCRLCVPAVWVPLDQLVVHVRDQHDPDCEIVTWPDGQPVIVDHTLDPDDFNRTGVE